MTDQQINSMSSAYPAIVSMGEILIDLFPAELGRKIAEVTAFHPKPGGAPANVAVAARRLGTPSAFIGKVGDDAFGKHLIQVLAEQGVETKGIRTDRQVRTTLAFIAMPDENHAEFVFYRNPGADLMIRQDELERGLLTGARAFHFGSLSLVDEPARSATREAVRLARGAGALISYDVNYRPSLWASPAQALQQARLMTAEADLLKVNEVELDLLAGQSQDLPTACQILLGQGVKLVAVTLGPKGSFFYSAEACGFVPAFPVVTVDATGCGDAFIAALLTRLVNNRDWRATLSEAQLSEDFRFANAAGAITALTQGVIPALPTAERVREFLLEVK
ncbi:MAG: PfkB family carbohydrate kinase [Anaerolineaceae bacterium]|nr:PfkB family carbohydrate kinase [Anaerolineaceae bacterium]